MKLLPTTGLSDSIRRMAEQHSGAASVIAILNRERPQNVMSYLRALDKRGIYGPAIWDMYTNECAGSIDQFVARLSE